MAELTDNIDKIKRYFGFTRSEIIGLATAILILAFIISFKEWGVGEFNPAIGIFNYFNALLVVALSVLVHVSVQRIWALATGYRLEWKVWSFGLLIGVLIVFLTNGEFWVIVPGGFVVHMMAGHRLGWFRYDINYWAVGLAAAVGSIATITLAVIFKGISGVISNVLIDKVIMFNIVYALYSILPIPPLPGSMTFFGSRMFYAFSTAGIIATALLLQFVNSVLLILVGAFIIAAIVWLAYYIVFESKAWS